MKGIRVGCVPGVGQESLAGDDCLAITMRWRKRSMMGASENLYPVCYHTLSKY